MQGNLIMAPAEFDVTFDFVIYLCNQKYNRKIEYVAKISQKFFADGNSLYSRLKTLLLMAKYFSRSTLPENFFFSS